MICLLSTLFSSFLGLFFVIFYKGFYWFTLLSTQLRLELLFTLIICLVNQVGQRYLLLDYTISSARGGWEVVQPVGDIIIVLSES